MAKTKISEWSTTPASNTDIDGINIAEGCAPSGINDAIRDLMAQVRSWQSGASGDPFNGPMNGTIGATTAYSGAFTTVSATGVITSTLATGTAPLTIASTTKVTNLNADLLDGADWASPAALGSTTPAAVSATTLSASGTVSGTGFSNYLASPPAIGGTTAAAGSFTTLAASSTLSVTGAGSIQGLTVGRGAGAVATNTAVGASALAAVTTAAKTTAIGSNVLSALTSGVDNTAIGTDTASTMTTGASNVAIGVGSMYANNGSFNVAVGKESFRFITTASYGTAVGYQAGYSAVSADYNTFIGYYAGRSTTGDQNTFLGKFAGNAITSGATNTIVGAYNGNQGGLDIRTASNYTVISDGGGTPHLAAYANGTVALQGAVPVAGTGITFPATQSASSNANTLDDYEEGTWTPAFSGAGSPSYSAQFGRYVKIGRVVYCTISIWATSVSGSSAISITGLPFVQSEGADNGQSATYSPALGGHCSDLLDATGRFRTGTTGSVLQGVKGALNTTLLTAAQFTNGSPQITGNFWYYTST